MSTGGSPITGYTVTATAGTTARRCKTSGATSCTVTGLKNGTNYSVTVLATNNKGNGPRTTALTATPSTAKNCALVGPYANLQTCVLTHANLTHTNLTRANLTRTDLTGANLTAANLTDADLTGANLTGADLTLAFLDGATLAGVTWSNTTCSDGTNSNNDGDTCVGHLPY